jgi:hypothetical protein
MNKVKMQNDWVKLADFFHDHSLWPQLFDAKYWGMCRGNGPDLEDFKFRLSIFQQAKTNWRHAKGYIDALHFESVTLDWPLFYAYHLAQNSYQYEHFILLIDAEHPLTISNKTIGDFFNASTVDFYFRMMSSHARVKVHFSHLYLIGERFFKTEFVQPFVAEMIELIPRIEWNKGDSWKFVKLIFYSHVWSETPKLFPLLQLLASLVAQMRRLKHLRYIERLKYFFNKFKLFYPSDCRIFFFQIGLFTLSDEYFVENLKRKAYQYHLIFEWGVREESFVDALINDGAVDSSK